MAQARAQPLSAITVALEEAARIAASTIGRVLSLTEIAARQSCSERRSAEAP